MIVQADMKWMLGLAAMDGVWVEVPSVCGPQSLLKTPLVTQQLDHNSDM